ncbi:hypothetical protein EX895_004463 [Sporisorium graminicola]|uniref:CNH domain-containing protein n=1 Tax=Sporisorium graminicola TaxID=280036 RepID=A0A4U7KV06_9BASI|nr:hypothetical protein EX895_004463 [Sporisorium graminicola]TKY86822.1 hypothetical protein EX895_004463 [Sporisorium graminicola]
MASSQATVSQEPVPPYSLAPLLFPTLPIEDAAGHANPSSPAAIHQNAQRAIRCSESDGSFLYVGTSDGVIHSFQISSRISAQLTSPSYSLKHSRSISHNAKPIEKIVLLRPFNAAAILCEGVVSFLSLPEWSPIRSLPSTRAVSTVLLDDDESEYGSGTDAAGMISICLVRRKNVILAKIGAEGRSGLLWATVKDLPLPGGAIFARRFADTLCIANATEYSLVNLSSGHITPLQLPISQTGESPSAQVRPSIVTIPVEPPTDREGSLSPAVDRSSSSSASVKCEFLVTSHSGSITLGVFVKTSGEPAPKLLEWPSHPRSVTYDGKNLVSLLRNDTIEIHMLGIDSVDKVQTLQLPPGLDPRFLQSVEAPLSSTPSRSSDEPPGADALTDLNIIKASLNRLEGQEAPVLRRASDHASPVSLSQRQILLCGRNSTSCIQQDPLLSWTVQQLHRGRLRNLRQSLDSYRSNKNPLQRKDDSLRISLESSIAHALLGIELLHRTDFSAAGEVLRYANLDPRLILALFPGLQQGQQKADEAIMPALILSNLGRLKRPDADQLQSIDELVDSNLAFNYSPPLDVATDKALVQLRQQLVQGSERMLRTLLEAWRADAAAALASPSESKSRFWAGSFMDEQMLATVNACVDSAYLRLIVERRGLVGEDDTAVDDDLTAFLGSKHACESSQVEKALEQKHYFSLLADHYEKTGNVQGSLRTWTALVDGKLSDASGKTIDVPSALSKVASLLKDEDDPTLLSTYGRWLVRKDSEAGIQILTKVTAKLGSDPSQNSATRSKAQELESIRVQKATINELRDIDADAATKYLEAVALSTTKVQDEQMHRELAAALLRRVEDHLKDDSYRRKLDAVAQDYAFGSYAESFFAHLALASDGSPKEADRLKLAMLLQGSTVLDYEALLAMIAPLESLIYEKAIIFGKLGLDSEALSLLAITLRDANSAEAYCSQDGEVLSPMLACSIAEDYEGLRPFAAMLSRTYAQRVKAHARVTAQRALSPVQRKQELLKQLLSVYMINGAEEKFRIATAHLLNTQALHLDGREVLELVPKDWSLQTLETFLTQSLRRQLHRRREMQMLKNIAKCRSLDVAEDLWARQRAMGGVLQDTDVDGGFGDVVEDTSYADWKEGQNEQDAAVELASEKKQTPQRQRQHDTVVGKGAIIDGVRTDYEIPPSSAIVHADADDVDDLT